jgi:predicted nucleic acid-binding protein
MKGMDTNLAQRPTTSTTPTAFVDVSVIAAYLNGGEAASQLFDNRYRGRVRFAVDPVVLQEVLILPQIQDSPQLFETVADRLNFEILPLDVERSQMLVRRARALRNRTVHSSGILVAASAHDCDYLITYDRALKELIEGDKPRVVTPEQFTSLIPTP